MEKVIVTLNPREKKELNIRRKTFNLIEFEEITLRKRAKKALEEGNRIAKETGLSKMTNKDINSAIKWARKRA
jgi:hypothetical protein